MTASSRLLRAADLIVRKARRDDLDAVDAIEQASFSVDRFSRRALRRLLASPSAETLITERDGAPAGYVIVLFRKGSTVARLYSLAVRQEARGTGVGSTLARAAAECAMTHGARRLRLEVRASNEAARALYAREGFRALGEIPGYYPDGEPALVMERLLERETGKDRAR